MFSQLLDWNPVSPRHRIRICTPATILTGPHGSKIHATLAGPPLRGQLQRGRGDVGLHLLEEQSW